MTYVDPLRRAARAAPEAPALVDGRHGWSYRALDRAADRLAFRLVAAGVRPGDRVALLLPPGPEGVLATHAVPRAGGVLAPLNVKWTEPERARALRGLAPRLVVATRGTAEAAGLATERESAGPDEAAIVLAPSDLDDPREPDDALDPVHGRPPLYHPRESDVFAILWTSGTSGTPRGVELTRQNLEASARAAAVHLALRPADCWHATLGLAHVGGLALVVRAAVVGCRVHVHGAFSPAELDMCIDAGAVTHASLVPAMLDRLLRERGERSAPATLRCILLGGAPAPLPLVERAVGLGFPVAVTYGLTEASSQVATATPDRVRSALAATGELPAAPPLPGVELRIAGDGEILVRGPTVARGYFEPAPGTADAPPPFPRDAEGWLSTGDLGRLDENGHLRVSGRISERIISGGVNVDPLEVEAVVRRHPAVVDAVVLGLPDPEWGERVCVAAVLRGGAALTPGELLDFTRAHLSAPKRPRALATLHALPRNANGKVDREHLRGLDWR